MFKMLGFIDKLMLMVTYLKSFKRNISLAGIVNSFLKFQRLDKLRHCDILYLCHDNSRPIFLKGKYYSPLIDSLIHQLKEYSSYTLALPFSRFSGGKASGNTVNLNLYIIIALLKRITKNQSFGLKKLKNDPIFIFYQNLLESLAPKVILGIQPSTELCLAAKEAGVKVIDVQHGIISTEEKNGFYSLSKRHLVGNIGWPDFIFCRNQESLNEVSKLKNHTSGLLIGNLNKYFYEEIYQDDCSAPPSMNSQKTILYTFQPSYTEEFAAENNIDGICFPLALLDKMRDENYTFILKLHPSQIQKKNLWRLHMKVFTKLFSKSNNVDFLVANQRPLEFALARSDLHITFNSAALFDAYDFGITTILLDKKTQRLRSYYGELLKTDLVEMEPDLTVDFDKYFKKKNKKEIYEFNLQKFIEKEIGKR